MPNWILKIAPKAKKVLKWLPDKDRRLVSQALDEMTTDPFYGDIQALHNEQAAWRLRVGNYRIFFDVYKSIMVVDVLEIKRRTSNTY